MIWQRLGEVSNFVEPFAGSCAVLLLRPDMPQVETLNDLDCYVANFWRATQQDPEGVVDHADGPVNEVDLHSRHRYLVLSEDAAAFREKMRTDPDHFDVKIAGWWCWGLCMWIGSGWCTTPKELQRHQNTYPRLSAGGGVHNQLSQKIPHMDSGRGMDPAPTSAEWQQIPAGERPLTGIHLSVASGKRPRVHGERGGLPSIHGNSRPQLADTYDIGRGVHAEGELGTCAQRREWLLDWFGRLRDRLRCVRVCCGHWMRVCNSPSVTTRLGITGVFLDPPYSHKRKDGKASRSNKLYGNDGDHVDSLVDEVREWCLEWGKNPLMRIALCGYEGEGHEELEKAGWAVEHWHSQGGYGNRSEVGRKNARRERVWFSPHCVREKSLFANLEGEAL